MRKGLFLIAGVAIAADGAALAYDALGFGPTVQSGSEINLLNLGGVRPAIITTEGVAQGLSETGLSATNAANVVVGNLLEIIEEKMKIRSSWFNLPTEWIMRVDNIVQQQLPLIVRDSDVGTNIKVEYVNDGGVEKITYSDVLDKAAPQIRFENSTIITTGKDSYRVPLILTHMVEVDGKGESHIREVFLPGIEGVDVSGQLTDYLVLARS
ncbi:MAG: hypothetical protein U0946_05770 [Patescibacteria group bacterium]|nr:hypothetical protein [Patescibacteria group bacterium]